jgi:membrane fusion protein, multidrug efflux system
MRRTGFFSRLGIGAALLALAAGCGDHSASSSQPPAQQGGSTADRPGGGTEPSSAPAVEVVAGEARNEPWPRVLTVVGSLAVDERATLGTKVSGRLAALEIDLGQAVKRGQTLARIDATDYELAVRQAQALLQQARAQLGLAPVGSDGAADPADGGGADGIDPEQTPRVRAARAVLDEADANLQRGTSLLQQKVIGQSEFDKLQADQRVAQSDFQDALQQVQSDVAVLAQRHAGLEIARQQVADTQILAPFDGVVLERLAGQGDFLSTGARVASLVRIDPLRLRAEIPERSAPQVRAGQSVRFTVEGDEKTYQASLARIRPELDEQSRMLLAEADVANPDGALRAGSFARIEIVIDSSASALSVPASAVRSFAGVDKVLAVAGGVLVEKRVTLGRRESARVEVLAGLAAGERVVLEPGNLQSGLRARIAQ